MSDAATESRKRYNVVRFVPDSGNGLTLKLEQPFRRTAGMKPDTFTALVPESEMSGLKKSGAYGINISGTLELWGANDPGSDGGGDDDAAEGPDVRLEEMRIIDAEVVAYGQLQGAAGVGPIMWRIFVTDMRDDWAAGRGGFVDLGIVNPSTPLSATNDPAYQQPPQLMTNSELVNACLDAMGVDYVNPAAGLFDQATPIADLDWRGASAPAELGKLLETLGATLTIGTGGKVYVWGIGTGAGPEVPSDRLIASTNVRGDDHRADMLVFTSAPNACKVTQTLDGPSEDTFQYVLRVQQKDQLNGPWVEQQKWADDNRLESPQLLVQDNFDGAPGYASLLYYAIRLSPKKFDPLVFPIFAGVYEADGSRTQLTATSPNVAIYSKDGVWVNEADHSVVVHRLATGTGDQGNVLELAERLGQVSQPGDAGRNFKEVDSFKVRFTTFDRIAGTNKPKYYKIGFTFTQGTLNLVTADPDTGTVPGESAAAQVSMPHWNVVTVDGNAPDVSDYAAEAGQLAQRYFSALNAGTTRDYVEGFFAQELNGLASEIEYNQDEGTTTIISNSFFRPASAIAAIARKSGGQVLKFPSDSTLPSTRTADASAGVATPGQMLNPRLPAPQFPQGMVLGRTVCKGPDGEADFHDNYQWVQLLKIAAPCQATTPWSLSDTQEIAGPCPGDDVLGSIVAAVNVGNCISRKHEQPGKLVVLLPLAAKLSNTTESGDTKIRQSIRYAIAFIDPTDAGRNCEDSDSSKPSSSSSSSSSNPYQQLYTFGCSWNCREKRWEKVEEVSVVCVNPDSFTEQIDSWFFKNAETADGVRKCLYYWNVFSGHCPGPGVENIAPIEWPAAPATPTIDGTCCDDSSSDKDSSTASSNGSDKSSAIVPARWTRGGYTALFTEEAPNVWFNDVITFSIPQRRTIKLPIDPKFIDVCAPDTIVVSGISVDRPISVGVSVDGRQVVVRFRSAARRKINITIRLSAIRKGFVGKRFPNRTRSQFVANERFLNSAYPST